MSNSMTRRTTPLSLLLGVAVTSVVAVGSAQAQEVPLTISPSGETTEPPPADTDSAPAAVVLPPGGNGEAAADPGNAYYGDYLEEGDLDDANERTRFHGVIPRTHTVVSGDTLWGISDYYFNNPWNWPKVWSLNPEITNPHWIYPGNIVRLRDANAEPADAAPINEDTAKPVALSNKAPRRYGLRQLAYVDIEELEDSGTIDGATDEKELLSTGDSVYLTYPEDKLPKVGERLAIYRPAKKVKSKGKTVGSYVTVVGELQVSFAKEGKRARAVVLRSVDAIERGMLVGPLKLNFSDVKPVANEKMLDGSIIEQMEADTLIGAQQAVIIDRGSEQGVKVGNRFLVIRRGDALQGEMSPGDNVGQDDDDYPARAIGEIIILQTSKNSALGFVTLSIHEFGIGDRVFMRKGQ